MVGTSKTWVRNPPPPPIPKTLHLEGFFYYIYNDGTIFNKIPYMWCFCELPIRYDHITK